MNKVGPTSITNGATELPQDQEQNPAQKAIEEANAGSSSGWSFLVVYNNFLTNNPLTRYVACQVGLPLVKNIAFCQFEMQKMDQALQEKLDEASVALFNRFLPKLEEFGVKKFFNFFEGQANVSSFLSRNEFFLEELVHYLVTKIVVNLSSMTGDEDEDKVSLSQVIERTHFYILNEIKEHEVAIRQIFDLSELKRKQLIESGVSIDEAWKRTDQEREASLKKKLESVTRYLSIIAFPDKGADLPLNVGVRNVVFYYLENSLFPELVSQMCHAYYAPKLKGNELEKLCERLGKRELTEGLSDEEKTALFVKNLKVESKVEEIMQLCRAVVGDAFKSHVHLKDWLGHFLTSDEDSVELEFSEILSNFVAPFEGEEGFLSYLQDVLSEMVFKVLTHQAGKADPLDDLFIAHLIKQFAEDANKHLGNVDRKELKDLYIRQQGGEEVTALIREKFTPYTKALLASLCEDASHQLFFSVPPRLREKLYTTLEREILPDLLHHYYRGIHVFELKSEEVQTSLNSSLKGENQNYVNSFCGYLAKWGAAFAPHQLSLQSEALAKLIPATYVNPPKALVAKNVSQVAHDLGEMPLKGAMDKMEEYLRASVLTVMSGLLKNLSKIEPNAFSEFVETLMKSANSHLKEIYEAKSGPGNVTSWGRRKSVKEGFSAKGLLHRALQGEKQKNAYFQDLTDRLLKLCDFNSPECFSLPKEHQEAVFKILRESILPNLLKKVFSSLTDPQQIDKMLYDFLKTDSKLTPELEKARFTQMLGEIQTLAQREISGFLIQVDRSPNDPKWLVEKGKLIQKISDLQRRLYSLQTIKERAALSDLLNGIQDDIIAIEPQKESIELTKLREKIDGSDQASGLIQSVGNMQVTYSKFGVTDADRNDPFNRLCGELVLSFVDLLPQNTLIKTVFSLKNIHDDTASTIGKIVREQADSLTFVKIINQVAKGGVKSLVDAEGDWFGTNGNTEYLLGSWQEVSAETTIEPGNQFFKNVKGVDYQFIQSNEDPFHFSKSAQGKPPGSITNEVLTLVDNAIKTSVFKFFKEQFKALRVSKNLAVAKIESKRKKYVDTQTARITNTKKDKFFDAYVKTYFVATNFILQLDQFGRRVASEYNDTDTFFRKACDLIEKAAALLLHPVSVVVFALINIYFRLLTRGTLNVAHMEIHENLIFEAVDDFFSRIPD